MRHRLLCLVAVAAASLLWAAASPAATFKIDPAHTNVTFRVRHLFTMVTGRFKQFEGRIVFDESKPLETKVDGTIDVASINTDNEKRDEHLRSADFFDVERFPKITFSTSKVTDVEYTKKTAKLHGSLTMHGVERSAVLEAAFLGMGKDPWGNQRAGFRCSTTVDRKDFGLNWNKTLETGGVLVGDEVEIEIDIEAILEQ